MIVGNRWEVDKKEIYTITTMAGEYVGRIEFVDRPGVVRVKSPLLLMTDQESGSQQFIPTISMTGESDSKYVDFNVNNIIAIVPTHEAYAKEYTKATSGIVIPNG